MLSIIVDETEEKAKAKYEEYRKYVNLESSQAIIGGWSGVDLPSSMRTRFSTM